MSEASTCLIRPLRPEEVARAVEIHQAAFQGFFLSFLGPAFLTILYRFYVQGSTEIALAGEYNGQIVAVSLATVHPQGFYKRLASRYFWRFAWASVKPLLRKPSIFPRLLRALVYRAEVPNIPEGAVLWASLCTDNHFQGMGFGKQVAKATVEELWRRGASFAYLTTDRDNNDATRRFHESLGWVAHSEFTTPEGRPMICYIKKRL